MQATNHLAKFLTSVEALAGIAVVALLVLHHGYETSGCIVHAAKSMTLCCSALT